MPRLRFLIVACAITLCSLTSIGQDSSKVRKVKAGILPILGYTPETQLMTGAIAQLVFKTDTGSFHRPTNIKTALVLTWNKQLLANFWLNHYFKNKPYNYQSFTEAVNYPMQYFGAGNNTTADFEWATIRYVKSQHDFNLIFDSIYFVGASIDYQVYRIADLDSAQNLMADFPEDLGGGYQIGIGPAFTFDKRDNIFYASKGSYLKFNSFAYPSFAARNSAYFHIRGEGGFFKSLRHSTIIGLGYYFGMNLGSRVPFYQYEIIGSSHRLRGNTLARFSDRNAYYINLELRQHVWRRFKAVAFTGIGNVAPSPSSFDWSQTKTSLGAGIRWQIIKDELVNLRIDYAFGSDGQRGLYFGIGEVF